MNHVGNDIVDLETPEARNKCRDGRFMKKILTDAEQSAVDRSDRPDAMLWAMWAAKESAYKAIAKSVPDASSAPLKYRVTIRRNDTEMVGGRMDGAVATPHGCVAITVFFYERVLHCIGINGHSPDTGTITLGYGKIDFSGRSERSVSRRESDCVRALALADIARITGRAVGDMAIKNPGDAKGPRPPVLYYNGRRDELDISLSHDGRFVGYAVCKL